MCLVVEEAYDDVGVAFGIQFLVSPRHMTNVSKSLFLYRSISRSLWTRYRSHLHLWYQVW